MADRCSTCGYFREDHVTEGLRCPNADRGTFKVTPAPAVRDWHGMTVTIPVPKVKEVGKFPAPVRTSREIGEPLVSEPVAVAKLRMDAERLGWRVIQQYSRGSLPHSTTGRPGAKKDLYALRFGGHPSTARQAFAIYSRNVAGGAWSWSSMMVWGPDLPPYPYFNLALMTQFLREGPGMTAEQMQAWIQDLRETSAAADAWRKQRETARKAVRALDDKVQQVAVMLLNAANESRVRRIDRQDTDEESVLSLDAARHVARAQLCDPERPVLTDFELTELLKHPNRGTPRFALARVAEGFYEFDEIEKILNRSRGAGREGMR